MEVLFAAVPVARFEYAVDWYTRLFGRPADIVPNEHEVMWRVAEAGWLYVIDDAERAGQTVVTIAVADLDAAVSELATRGISAQPIEDIGDAGRKAKLSDPEGNVIALIQVAS